jgi:hypothetical protein
LARNKVFGSEDGLHLFRGEVGRDKQLQPR